LNRYEVILKLETVSRLLQAQNRLFN